jgi:Carboxypeptidase regulatory-like domain
LNRRAEAHPGIDMRWPALLVTSLLGCLVQSPGLVAVPLRVHAELAQGAEAAGDHQVVVRLIPQQPEGDPQSRSAALPVPGEAVVEVPAGRTWQVLAEAPDLWAAPQWIASSSGTEQLLNLRFFPAAALVGHLQPPSGKAAPAVVDLRVEASPGLSLRPFIATPLTCPVAAGKFRCQVPALKLDLRLRAAGFIPAYRWDVTLSPGQVKDLGVLPLQEGASVVGWVRALDARPIAAAGVRLAPQMLGLPANRATAAGVRAMVLETRTNERGFFQFVQAPPGLSVVSTAKDGFATTSHPGIEVRPGLESTIPEPLILTPPLKVQITLDPQAAPSGDPWKVTLERRDEGEVLPLGPVYRGETNHEGRWEEKGLSPGRYVVAVKDRDTGWLSETIELRPEQTAFSFSLSGVRLVGHVYMGREPLEATLSFRAAARHAKFSSDAKGSFVGLLSQEGPWEVEILSAWPRLHLRLEPVDVRKRPGSGYAEVEIQVPNTRLRGRVLDEQDAPVPHASLFVLSPQKRSSSATADASGEFEVRGLTAGPFYVHAEEGDRESEWVEARVEEDRDTPELRLVLRARLTVSGRVTSPNGPVAGAEVEVHSPLNDVGAASADRAVTGSAGEFTVHLPSGSQYAHVAVVAPGYATRMLVAPLGDPPLLEISLELTGGTLAFDLGNRSIEEALRFRAGLVAHAGSFVPLATAAYWARLLRVEQPDPHRLVLPIMEAGDYLLCLGPEAQIAVAHGQEPPALQCSAGSLAPLQELTLTLPRAALSQPAPSPVPVKQAPPGN